MKIKLLYKYFTIKVLYYVLFTIKVLSEKLYYRKMSVGDTQKTTQIAIVLLPKN